MIRVPRGGPTVAPWPPQSRRDSNRPTRERCGGRRRARTSPSARPAEEPMSANSDVVLHGLAREVGGITRRHLVAAAVPAALLGAGADAIEVLRHHVGAEIALGLLLAMAFELYVGYAELIVAADRAPGPRPPIRRLLWRAAPRTPALVLASVVAVMIPLAATGALVLPGLWLMTRWSLFAPAIVHERLRPLASLRRSNELVRGVFWPVFIAVTGSVIIEHAVIHATAHTAKPLLGPAWAGLLGAALATMIVSPPAAFTISLVYERLEQRAQAHADAPGCAHPVDALVGHPAGGPHQRDD